MQTINQACFGQQVNPECKGCMFLAYLFDLDTQEEKPCDLIKCKNR